MVQVAVWPRGIQRSVTSGPLGIDWDTETARVGRPVFMTQAGALQQAAVSSRYENGFGGTDLLSWTIVPHGGFIGGMFRPGDHCRVTQGGGIVGEGEISEVLPLADGSVEFQARGYAYNLSEYNSIFSDDSPVIPRSTGTTPPGTITNPTTRLLASSPDKGGWDYAIDVLGMPISQVVGTQTDWASPVGISDVGQRTYTLAQVVTAREQQNARRWSVWGRTLVLDADPSTPMWQIDTPDGVVGTADTDYATHVGVWYRWWNPDDWTSGATYGVGALVSWGSRWYKALVTHVASGANTPGNEAFWDEIPIFVEDWMTDIAWAVDTTDGVNRFDTRTVVVDYRGALANSLSAAPTAQALLDQVRGRMILTGSFTIAPEGGLKSIGGGKAPLGFVRAGQGIKLNKLRTTQGNLLPDLFIIGRTDWQWQADGSESLTITPMGAVPRDLGSILAGIPYADSGGVA